MREGELLGLLKRDFEFVEDGVFISIRKQDQYVPHKGMIFSPVKTDAGQRKIKVGKSTANILREHLEKLDVMKAEKKNRWKEYGLVFPTTVGTPQNSSHLLSDYHSILKKAILPNIRFHDIRHSFASYMLANKIPTVIVLKILGHSKPSVTEDVYYHKIPSTNDEVMKLMDSFPPVQIENGGCQFVELLEEENEVF